MYLGSISKPNHLRLEIVAATAVVPEPIQLSRTMPPSFVYVFMRYSNKATGFCVGCNRLLSRLNILIDVGYLSVYTRFSSLRLAIGLDPDLLLAPLLVITLSRGSLIG